MRLFATIAFRFRGILERFLTPPETTGAWGEDWATRYLRTRGCRILGRNVHPCRYGELDIIARKGKTILFVEVKTRRSERYGRPITAVAQEKRRLLRKCATRWLSAHGHLESRTPYRFDVVEVLGTPGKGIPQITWVQAIDMSRTRAPELF